MDQICAYDKCFKKPVTEREMRSWLRKQYGEKALHDIEVWSAD
jgi:hypothetical protein